MIRRPPRSTLDRSSAASDVYKRQVLELAVGLCRQGSRQVLRQLREVVSANELVGRSSHTPLLAHPVQVRANVDENMATTHHVKAAGMQRLEPWRDLRAREALRLEPPRVEPRVELAQRIDVAVTSTGSVCWR